MKRAPNGFTLIELAVTMAIIALLATFTIPSLGTWMENSRIRTTAEFVQDGLRQAQAEAVKENRVVAFILTATQPSATNLTAAIAASTAANYWYATTVPWTTADLTSGNATIGTATTTSHSLNMVAMGITSSDASMVTVTSATPALCFSPFGRPTGTYVDPTGTVTCGAIANTITYVVAPTTANAASQSLNVTVSTGGQIRMCNPAKSLPAPDGC